jgi:hypothetical protein
MKLLSISSDAKTIKGETKGYLTGILYLAPAFESGVINVCPYASAGCKAACLYTAGRASIFPEIKEARIRKTKWYAKDKPAFIAQLAKDIAALIRQAAREGLTPAVRLNGTSDLPVETWGLMELFTGIQFYDYTKSHARAKAYKAGTMPKNYHLTFSLSETNEKQAIELLAMGVNVAMVYAHVMPTEYLGHKALNGDESDLRFLDPADKGYIVALKAKGQAKKDKAGFSVNTAADGTHA